MVTMTPDQSNLLDFSNLDIIDTTPGPDFPTLPVNDLSIIQHGHHSITQDLLGDSDFFPINHPEIAQNFAQLTDVSPSSSASSSNSSITTIHTTQTNDIDNNNVTNNNNNTSNIIDLTLATYLDSDEEHQQKLWLQALASNNTDLIQRLLPY
jgi:hypothetical protein